MAEDTYGFPSEWEPFATGGAWETPAVATGGVTDWIGAGLGAWERYDTRRQEQRLLDTKLQAMLYGVPSRYSNPQAKVPNILDNAGGGMNPLVLLALVGIAGLVIFKLAK